jgi:hypothetical protein
MPPAGEYFLYGFKGTPSARRAARPRPGSKQGRADSPGGVRERFEGAAPSAAGGAGSLAAAAAPLPRTRRQAVPAVTHPGDRARKSSRAVLLAPDIVSPRKDHRQERSLRSRPSDGAARHS